MEKLSNQIPTFLEDEIVLRDEIVLKEDEIICDRCKGSGYEPGYDPSRVIRLTCQKCQGERKLDWISAITGVPPKQYYSGSSSSCGGMASTSPNIPQPAFTGMAIPKPNKGSGICGYTTERINGYLSKGMKEVVKLE